jgi:aquaporin related protein
MTKWQCDILSYLLFQALTPKDVRNSLGMTTISDLVTPLQGFFMEALITFVLVLTVEAVCDDRRTDVKGSAPLAIGLSITTCHLGAVSVILTTARIV